LNPIPFNPENQATNENIAFLFPHFERAKWFGAGGNLILFKEANFNLTALGEQRFRELYQIQQAFDPAFFGKIRGENDGAARAGAQATYTAIMQELGAMKFDLPHQQFLM